MKRNGFTLIELLAVIVILAIIALIATPIILGIINDAREESNERSVELYAAAVKNGIAAYQLIGLNAPTSFSDLTVQYDGDVKCKVQELYEDGSFYLEGCKVNGSEKEYSYGIKKVMEKPCTYLDADDDGTINLSDEVTCGAESFYVISSTDESIRMLRKDVIGNGTYTQEYDEVPYEDSELYPIVQAYETKLRDELKLEGVSTTFLSLGEAGCGMDDGCSEEYGGTAPEWVYSTTYWLIDFHNNGYGHYKITEYGHYAWDPDCETTAGIRPVVIMSKNNI